MHKMSNQEKNETINWLIKQRDGLIIGDYRNILYNLYQKINSLSSSKNQQCYLKDIIDTKSLYYKNENQLLELCETLKELGYIEISYTTNNITITILKTIDF